MQDYCRKNEFNSKLHELQTPFFLTILLHIEEGGGREERGVGGKV